MPIEQLIVDFLNQLQQNRDKGNELLSTGSKLANEVSTSALHRTLIYLSGKMKRTHRILALLKWLI